MKVSGEFMASVALAPREKPQVPIKWEVGLPLGPVRMLWRRENHFPLPESEPRIIQSLA